MELMVEEIVAREGERVEGEKIAEDEETRQVHPVPLNRMTLGKSTEIRESPISLYMREVASTELASGLFRTWHK